MHAHPGHLHPTARRPPGLAWVGSLLVHATALAALVWANQPATQAPSLGRRLGALMVRLEAITAPHAHEPIQGNSDAAAPRAQDTPRPAQPTRAEPRTPHTIGPADIAQANPPTTSAPVDETHAPKAEPAEPLATQASPPPAQPEARWGGLFTPVIRQPLGRGRWSGMAQPTPAPQDQAALQQAQAMQAQRAALMQRLQSLGALLPQTPLMGRCQVHITLGALSGLVSCDDTSDQNRVRAVLNDFLAPPSPAKTESSALQLTEQICLDLEGPLVRWMPCSPAPQQPKP